MDKRGSIPEDVKQALLSLFGEKTVLEDSARLMFDTRFPFDEELESRLERFGAVGAKVRKGYGDNAVVTLSDGAMRQLDEKLKMRVRVGESGVINEMLRRYRTERNNLMMEIPMGLYQITQKCVTEQHAQESIKQGHPG